MQLLEKLRNGIVTFKFLKVDGTIREAVGSLNLDYIGIENKPKGGGKPKPENIQVFFDMEKMQWRSYKKEYLIEIC